jgi:tetratricopeptide (TPR) repeat protein
MIRYIVTLFLFLPAFLFAQEEINPVQMPAPTDYSQKPAEKAEILLEQANQHYIGQEYEKAVQLYEQILAGGKTSVQLYYNLGNAWYKLNDPPRALLYYERARLLAPANENIDFNIRVAGQFIVDNIEALPQPFFLRWRSSVVNLASADTWARISLAGFLLFLILLGTFLFARYAWVKKTTFWSGIFLLIFSVFSYSFAGRQQKAVNDRAHAIIFCPRVTVKSAPATTGTDLFLIHEGLKVEITDSLNNWKEIRLPDGNKGWMPDSCAVRI